MPIIPPRAGSTQPMAPRAGGSRGTGAMPASLPEYTMDGEANRRGKKSAKLAALSIPTLPAATMETSSPDEPDASRRRQRGSASGSGSYPAKRRSSRPAKERVHTVGECDEGQVSTGESDSDSGANDEGKSEKDDADFVSDDDDDDDDDDTESHGGVIELDEDGTEVAEEVSAPDDTHQTKRKEKPNVKRKRNSEYALNTAPMPGAAGDGVAAKKRNFTHKKTSKAKSGPRRKKDEPEPSTDPKEDAKHAFLAFLAPSTAVGVARGKIPLETATFGLSELRAVADSHGFGDWTDQELAAMLAPCVTGAPRSSATTGKEIVEIPIEIVGGTDPFAADALRRTATLAAAKQTRVGLFDLEKLVEEVGAWRKAT